MVVTRDTPEELVLERRPWLAAVGTTAGIILILALGLSAIGRGAGGGIWLIASGIGIGAAAFWAVVRFEALRLSRQSARADLVVRTVFGTRRVSLPLAEIERAAVESRASVRRGGRAHRPVLLRRDGSAVPLTALYGEAPDAERARAAINTWLDARRTTGS